ncbi:MAG: SPOR domain-containing protein [Chitinophagales bacterium]
MRGYKNQLLTLFAITLLVFCSIPIVKAQSGTASTSLATTTEGTKTLETRYQIQLAAYKNPQLIKLDNFKNVGHAITIEKNDKDIHRVLVKDLQNEEAAKTALAIVQAKGYKDAFYTTYQAEIETAVISQPATGTNTTPVEEMTDMSNPIEPVFMNELEQTKDEVFLVELGAFESVKLLHNTAIIRSMGELFRQKVEGGERIYIGVFEDVALANLTLQKVKAQGYNDASLRKVERSKIYNANQQNQPIQNVSDVRTTPTAPAIVAANSSTVAQSFEKMNFQIFKVDAYDPTNTSSFINTMLQGKELSPAVLAFFDKNADKNFKYFSIGSFAIGANHSAYMVRSGKGSFHNDNNIYLYIYDQQNEKMIGKELISSVMTTTNTYSKIQTWITDANKDGVLDLLIYNKSETTTPDGQYASQNDLTGKVWTGNTYTVADIKDAAKLKQKLGVN